MQRRPLPLVGCVHIRSQPHELLDEVQVTLVRSHMKRRLPLTIALVDEIIFSCQERCTDVAPLDSGQLEKLCEAFRQKLSLSAS